MSELQRMARPLLERPPVAPTSIDDLERRGRRRRRVRVVTAGAVTLVAALAVTLVVLVVAPVPTIQSPPAARSGRVRLAAFIQTGVSVPDSVLETVGLPAGVQLPTPVAGQPALNDLGKPAVVYVGAEFCPYCAVERWGLLVALSRFGTFSTLGQVVSSSSNDVYADLKSWSFSGSSYTSPYLTFDPAEIESSTPTSGGGYEPLDALAPLQKQAFDTYDRTGQGGIPFVDLANRFSVLGASASPAPLEGLSLDQVATLLDQPSSPVAQAVDGTANALIGALCQVTGVSSSPVCSSPVAGRSQAGAKS
jgi:hypothetical protein